MNLRKLIWPLFAIAILWSCSKDDGPPNNTAPKIAAQSFTVKEDISDTANIGTVTATDADKDDLTFSLTKNSADLFEIAPTGVLSLAKGKALSFATKSAHTLTVSVSDGTDTASAAVTVNVTEVVGEPTNEPPTADSQSFEVAEDVAVGDVIGTATGNDPEGDSLIFALVEDASQLFQVAENGEITLSDNKNLDFETQTEHELLLSVSDGTNDPVEFKVTITVTNVIESLFEDPASFITKWEVTDGQEIVLFTHPDFAYDYTIDWGDGSGVESLTDKNPSHVYETAGTYSVAIVGSFPALVMGYSYDQSINDALVDVTQWGTQQWKTMYRAFRDCSKLDFSATDVPDLQDVTDMSFMFYKATSFNGAIGNWDVGNVTNMASMFRDASAFNQDIGNWDVGNVTDMRYMFDNAISFNQDISGWNVGNVTDMTSMFGSASAFNQDIGNWDTSKVAKMAGMFYAATSFNQDIGNWNTSNVIDMQHMFNSATSFNQDLSGWDTGAVTKMNKMFSGATAFDQSLGAWEIGSVTDMSGMLDNTKLNVTNYGSTLIGWGSQAVIPGNITLGATGLSYCSNDTQTVYYRDLILVGNKGWNIIGDSGVNCP